MREYTHRLAPLVLMLTTCSSDTVTAETREGESETVNSTATELEEQPTEDEGGDEQPPLCDPWASTCGADQKCVPWANENGEFNEDRCVQVLGDRQPGQLCQWDGIGVGTDDCDVRSFCWNHDASGDGICREFCGGTPIEWSCDDAPSTCSLSGPVDNLCLPSCYPMIDPLIKPCLPGEACYLVKQAGWFACMPSGERGFGEICEQPNDCAADLLCIEALPRCAGEACCTAFCVQGLGPNPCEEFGPNWGCEQLFPVPAPGIGSPENTVGACVQW
jgi:hypothetical protein